MHGGAAKWAPVMRRALRPAGARAPELPVHRSSPARDPTRESRRTATDREAARDIRRRRCASVRPRRFPRRVRTAHPARTHRARGAPHRARGPPLRPAPAVHRSPQASARQAPPPELRAVTTPSLDGCAPARASSARGEAPTRIGPVWSPHASRNASHTATERIVAGQSRFSEAALTVRAVTHEDPGRSPGPTWSDGRMVSLAR